MKKSLIVCFIMLFFYSCYKEYTVKKVPYTGSELRIDGYYYMQTTTKTYVMIFYRNGIMFNFYDGFPTIDLSIVDNNIKGRYIYSKNDEYCWGTFIIKGNSIQYSNWHPSMRVAFPPSKSIGTILNDTTFNITKDLQYPNHEFDVNETYHFRQFSPKPDSTNKWIK